MTDDDLKNEGYTKCNHEEFRIETRYTKNGEEIEVARCLDCNALFEAPKGWRKL